MEGGQTLKYVFNYSPERFVYLALAHIGTCASESDAETRQTQPSPVLREKKPRLELLTRVEVDEIMKKIKQQVKEKKRRKKKVSKEDMTTNVR